MNPKVSVIVPIYNVEQYLHQCIDSIIGQSFNNLEIILVNDGSTDKSGDICEEYAKTGISFLQSDYLENSKRLETILELEALKYFDSEVYV